MCIRDRNEIRINLEAHMGRTIDVQIFDARGMIVREQHLENLVISQPVFDLDHFENGLYVIAIQVEGFRTVARKFIVEKGF